MEVDEAGYGNADAQANLGVMYAKGLGGLVVDEAEAVRLYRLAAEQGNADAIDALNRRGPSVTP